MAELTFTIERDTARPAVALIERTIASREARQAAGAGVRRTVRTYLRALPSNKQGFPSTGFYKSAAESVSLPKVEGDNVTISITQVGMRQRYLGGQIVPKDGKRYLTIPAQGIAYGRLAGDFTGLKFAFVRDNNDVLRPALISGDQGASVTGAKPKRRKGVVKPPIPPDQVMFWLVRSVMQQADPTVLPKPRDMASAAVAGIQSLIRAKLHDPTYTLHPDRDEETP